MGLIPPPTRPTENCFLHQVEDKVTLDDRLDKACEPGVDYGECPGVIVCKHQRVWLRLCE